MFVEDDGFDSHSCHSTRTLVVHGVRLRAGWLNAVVGSNPTVCIFFLAAPCVAVAVVVTQSWVFVVSV